MLNISNLYHYTIEKLEGLNIRYEIHRFPSGAIILDIWIRDRFYVIQFESDFIGFSEVKDGDAGFDAIPDRKFLNAEDYHSKIETVLTSN